MAQETVIIDIQVSSEQAVKNIAEAQAATAKLKDEQANLNDEYDKGKVTEQQYYKEMARIKEGLLANREAIRENNYVLKQNALQQREAADSLKQMRASLKQAQQAYDALSGDMRNGEEGKRLQLQISALTKQISAAEEATGRFGRNVGNYKNSILQAFGAMGGAAGGMVNPINRATGALGVMSKTPVIAVLGLLVNVLTKVVGGLKSSEENANRVSQSLAGVKAIGVVVQRVMQGLGNALGWLSEQFARVLEKLGLLKDEMQAQREMTQQEIAIQQEERKLIVDRAVMENKVAQLRAQAADAVGKSEKQRIALLRQAADEEMKIAEREKSLAQMRYNLIKQRNAQAGSSTEELREEAEAQAAVIEANTRYLERQRSLTKQISTLQKSVAGGAKATAEEVTKVEEDALKDEENLIKQAIKLRVELAEKGSFEELQARVKQIEAQRDEEVKAAEQAKATAQQRAENIRLIEAKAAQDIRAIRAEYDAAEEQRRKKAMEDAANEEALRRQNELNALVEGSQERLRLALEQKKQELDALHQLEGESNEQFRARELAAQKEYNDAQKALSDAQLQMQTAKAEAIGSIVGGVQKIIENAAGENEALAKASKVLALAQIAIESGVAVAKGIKSSQDMPFPANLAAMAATVSSILTGVASAISTVKSAQFATGGYVRGAGTATSDSIPARLSNGEAVINAKSTNRYYDLLSAINAAGGGVAFPKRGATGAVTAGNGLFSHRYANGGYVSTEARETAYNAEELSQAIATAVGNLHPEVSVKEISKVQNRVSIKELQSKKITIYETR